MTAPWTRSSWRPSWWRPSSSWGRSPYLGVVRYRHAGQGQSRHGADLRDLRARDRHPGRGPAPLHAGLSLRPGDLARRQDRSRSAASSCRVPQLAGAARLRSSPFVGLWLLITRTDFGKALEATREDAGAVALVGIDKQPRVRASAGASARRWSGSRAACSRASTTSTRMSARPFALIAYVTVALGGFGSVFGALAAGILVGLVEAVTATILPPSLKAIGIYATLSRGRLRASARLVRVAVDVDRSHHRLVPLARSRSAVAAFAHDRRRRFKLIAAACLVAVARRLPLVIEATSTLQNIIVLTLMYAALAQSWNILGGYCGQISLGHALYFGSRRVRDDAPLHQGSACCPGSACWSAAVSRQIDRARARLPALPARRPLLHHRDHRDRGGRAPAHRQQLGLGGAATGIQWPFGRTAGRRCNSPATSCPTSTSRSPVLIVTWLVTFVIERLALGLLVAGREGQRRRGREPRRHDLQVEDGGRGAVGLLHGDRRRRSTRPSCPISIPRA